MPGMPRNSDFVGAVRLAVGSLLPNGRPAIERVSRFLDVHPRTLQRRLAEAGFTYSKIIGEVRIERALDLIADENLTLGHIASILGYSDPAHFTRAFLSWTGVTPRSYRLRGPEGTASLDQRDQEPDRATCLAKEK